MITEPDGRAYSRLARMRLGEALKGCRYFFTRCAESVKLGGLLEQFGR